MSVRQQSVFFLEWQGGYDGNWPVNVENRRAVYVDDVIQGYATREDADAAVDALREGRADVDVREVRIP